MENIILLGTKDINKANWSNDGIARYSGQPYVNLYRYVYDIAKESISEKGYIYGIGYYVKNIKNESFCFIKITNVELNLRKNEIALKYEFVENSKNKSGMLYGLGRIGDSCIIDVYGRENIESWLEKYKIEINSEWKCARGKNDSLEKSEKQEVKKIKQDDTNKNKIKLFFSYSHKDEELRDELEKHLIILKRQGVIDTWHDRKIDASSILDKEIDNNLKDSNIILLLISVDFLASDYCYDIEMKEALKMHENKQAIVVPVILRSCDWTSAPFSKLMALPTDAKSITTWGDKDLAFSNVAKGIKNIVTKFNHY